MKQADLTPLGSDFEALRAALDRLRQVYAAILNEPAADRRIANQISEGVLPTLKDWIAALGSFATQRDAQPEPVLALLAGVRSFRKQFDFDDSKSAHRLEIESSLQNAIDAATGLYRKVYGLGA